MVTHVFICIIIFSHIIFCVSSAQGKSHRTAQGETRHKIWPALKMNWKVWTPIQFINVNYIPQKVRVLCQPPFAHFRHWVTATQQILRPIQSVQSFLDLFLTIHEHFTSRFHTLKFIYSRLSWGQCPQFTSAIHI